jgi:hypothetical protein
MDSARRAALRRVAVLAAMAACPAVRAGPGAREQCEALKRAAMSMAQELLRSHGEFPPYGLGLSAGDEVVELEESAPRDALRGGDAGDALRATLADALKARAVEATALVYEAAITAPAPGPRGDAIAIQLAHRDGYRAVIVYPYRFQDGDVVFGPAQVIEQKGGALPRPKRKAR